MTPSFHTLSERSPADRFDRGRASRSRRRRRPERRVRAERVGRAGSKQVECPRQELNEPPTLRRAFADDRHPVVESVQMVGLARTTANARGARIDASGAEAVQPRLRRRGRPPRPDPRYAERSTVRERDTGGVCRRATRGTRRPGPDTAGARRLPRTGTPRDGFAAGVDRCPRAAAAHRAASARTSRSSGSGVTSTGRSWPGAQLFRGSMSGDTRTSERSASVSGGVAEPTARPRRERDDPPDRGDKSYITILNPSPWSVSAPRMPALRRWIPMFNIEMRLD